MKSVPLLGVVACWLAVVGLSSPARAITLEVQNLQGDVHVKVDPSPRLRVEGLGSHREAGRGDIQTTRTDERIVVRCAPPDGEPINLDVQLPLGFGLEVKTGSGEIWVEGMVRQALLETDTGTLRLAAPWRATRLRLDADLKPDEVNTPRGVTFSKKMVDLDATRKIWRMRDNLDEGNPIYGDLHIRARAPAKVTLEDFTIPADWPLKMPWQAPAVLDEILHGHSAEGGQGHSVAPPSPPVEPEHIKPLAVEADAPLFRSDVRMVNLAVTVSDESGRPLIGLQREQFRVVEDGSAQQVTFAGSDEIPFNLAILLDLSGSTRPDREAMRAVAERLVSLLQPHDKVAIYALAGGMFHVVSGLTDDREKLLETIRLLPAVSGASPLYDTMVLAYAEELGKRPGERNALIVISDGIDNQVSRQETPSKVDFKKLVKAAGEMDALIYPIFLRSGERFGRGWSAKARNRLEQLALASGGRLFPAVSIHDLDPVLPELAKELRSVYSVAYYPQNQAFDGGWRNVAVEVVDRPHATIRARPGYFAR